MIKKFSWLPVLFLILTISGRAEDVRMKDVFRLMPDSLLPTLSANNRLDMIDFMDSQMKAEVTNLLGGKSEMTALSDDSLTIRMSDALTVQMLLLKPQEMIDSCSQVVCLLQIFGTDSLNLDTKIDFYTPQWQKLDERPQLSESDARRVSALDTKTILNFMDAILKKD
jgi:hypothetical protein